MYIHFTKIKTVLMFYDLLQKLYFQQQLTDFDKEGVCIFIHDDGLKTVRKLLYYFRCNLY